MKDLGQYFTDRKIIDYLVKLCNPKCINGEIETIYDGAAGTGGFLTQSINYLNNNNKNIDWELNNNNIYGSDINRNTYALLKLNLYLSTGEQFNNITLNDSLEKYIQNDGFDIILMNPPFGVKGLKYTNMNDKIKKLGINGTRGEILFLQNCMVNLAKNGRCAIIIPDGVLFNKSKMYKETRKYLLNNFELEKIIILGEGKFFKNTSVSTDILYFKNTGKPTNNVKFIKINKVNNDIEEQNITDISIDQIIENDYNLKLSVYEKIKIKETTLHIIN